MQNTAQQEPASPLLFSIFSWIVGTFPFCSIYMLTCLQIEHLHECQRWLSYVSCATVRCEHLRTYGVYFLKFAANALRGMPVPCSIYAHMRDICDVVHRRHVGPIPRLLGCTTKRRGNFGACLTKGAGSHRFNLVQASKKTASCARSALPGLCFCVF